MVVFKYLKGGHTEDEAKLFRALPGKKTKRNWV